MRTLRLSALLLRRSPIRAVMLAILVAVSIVVFALVSELSRVSQTGLDEAIVRDNGLLGSYEIVIDPDLQMTEQQQYAAVTHLADSLHLTIWGYWEDLPAVQSECPPFEQVGEQELRVLWKKPGVPFDLPFGQISGIDTEWCIDGQQIPTSALYAADEVERSIFGARIYINAYYRNVVLLSTLGPIHHGYTVIAGKDQDITDQVQQAMIKAVTPTAQTLGTEAASAINVVRRDRTGDNVRDASVGFSITYGVIGWGVLTLAALALLIMQTSQIRQRLWFYGLLQSLGCTNRRIAAMLVTDGAAIITAGTCLALIALRLSQNTIHDFADTAFGVDAQVLSGALLPRLAIGIAIILTIATAAPLAVALRRDPLEVLEAPRD